MWSLVRIVAVWILIMPWLKRVHSQDCTFTWDNGTVINDDNDFGVLLDTIQDCEPAGKEIMSVRAKNVVSIANVNGGTYIEPVLDATRLILKLTERFPEYEDKETAISITVRITFECAAGTSRTLAFVQPIEDTNNHPPEFIGVPYVYTLPMPFPKNIALNNFQPISARDVDLTNANVSFSLDPTDPNSSGFSVVWLSRDTDPKLFHATLRTEAVIRFSEDVTFNLHATDAGQPDRLNSTTRVTIKVDADNSILRFNEPLYIADLTNLKPEEANGKIVFASGEIGLWGGAADSTVTFAIHDDLTDYGKYFKPEAADDRSTVVVRLVDPPAELFLESFVVLRLVANQMASEETTVLHVSLPARASVPTPSTSPSSSSSTTDPSVPGTTDPCSSGQEECDNTDYIVAIVILGILLPVATVGLVVSFLTNRRIRRKLDDAVAARVTNGGRHVVAEMGEIGNGSVGPTPTPSLSSSPGGKTVAFHRDNIDETKIARL